MISKIDYDTTEYDKLKNGQLKRLADYWLRQYLLSVTPKRGGKYKCPLKNKYYPIDKIQVAHFIDRGNLRTRYDLDNVALISEQSNVWDAQIPEDGYKSKHHKDYEKWLGPEKVAQLLSKSKELIILKREDYINIIEKFRNGLI